MHPAPWSRARPRRPPAARLAVESLERRLALAAVTALDVANELPFARVGEPVTSGVPLPESRGLFSTDRLQVMDSGGRQVPAQFRVLSRWRGGPDDVSRPIRWLEVNFPADVPAGGRATYVLDDAGAGSSSRRLDAVQTADRITITTGPARFEIDRTAFDLFRTVWLDTDRDGRFSDGERIVVPRPQSGPFVQQGGSEHRAAAAPPLSVVLEEAGPLRAIVRAEGYHAADGRPLLRYVTRMTFHAGTSFVEVHHTIIEGRQPGSGNGDLAGQVATTLARAGLRVAMQLEGPATATLRGGTDAIRRGGLPAAATAAIVQESGGDANRALAYRATIDGLEVETGQRATRAWLDIADARWGLAVTTRDFFRKGPQRLAAAGDGTVQVEFPATEYTIRQAMGLDESVVFWFHTADRGVPEAERILEGFGKDRLLALAPGRWMIDSGALGRVPTSLPGRWSRADDFLRESAEASLAFASSPMAFGLMHYLDMPIDRFQVLPGPAGTIPAGGPDRVSWGNSYWDPGATLAPQFARTGDGRLLERLLFPLARHFSTTDMYDPDDTAGYTSGIGGARGEHHRGAWTGEYHYLESLWDHYYLTGDRRVLERGLAAARTYAFHPQFAVAADQGGFPTTTRTLSQKFATMLEAWLASGDAPLKAALDAQVREFLIRRFTPEGFVVPRAVGGDAYDAEQAFMVTLGIHDTIYDYHAVTGDPLARDFLVTVPQRIARHHRASEDPAGPDFMRFHTNVRVTRSAGGFTVTRTIPRGNSDDFFYLESYVGLGTALARSWELGGGTAARTAAEQLFDFAMPRLVGGILDKPTAMAARRLLPGLALLAEGEPAPTPAPASGGGAAVPGRAVLIAAADSFLDGRFGTDPAANHAVADTLTAFREGWSGGQMRPLLRFDLAALPSGQQVRRAMLRLSRLGVEGPADPLPVTVRAVSRAWDESAVSWGFARPGTPWTSPGGDVFPGGVTTSLAVDGDPGNAVEIDVTALVAEWVRGTRPNHGFMIAVGGADRGQYFASREHASVGRRPTLAIEVAVDPTHNAPPTDILLSNASLPENAGPNRLVGLLTAIDPDGGDVHAFSLAPGFGDNPLFRLDGGSLTAVRSLDFERQSRHTIRVRATDRTGAPFEKTFTISVTDVTQAPVVLEVRGPAPRGYRAGEQLTWEIVCSQEVIVTGRPALPVRLGGRSVNATYLAGSGGSRLTFGLTVNATDHAAAITTGATLTFPAGATIVGEARLVAALPGGGGPVRGVWIDTVAPRPIGPVIVPAARVYAAGEPLEFTVRFSEPVRVTGLPRITVQLFPGVAGSRTADYVGGSGGAQLRFRSVVRTGDLTPTGRGIVVGGALQGGEIVDAVGNAAIRTLKVPATRRITVDGRLAAAALASGLAAGSGGGAARVRSLAFATTVWN